MKKVFKTVSQLLLCGIAAAAMSGCDKDNSKPDGGGKVQMVDLGLSVKWAKYNLPVKDREIAHGDYYAWGETETKDKFTLDNSAVNGKSREQLLSEGIIDENGNLTTKYDVVSAKLGSTYRLPTKKEWEELSLKCKWTFVERDEGNAFYGVEVKGPNGNKIYFPLGGYISSSGSNSWNKAARYLSSTFKETDEAYYMVMFHYYDALGTKSLSGNDTYCGCMARPVCE